MDKDKRGKKTIWKVKECPKLMAFFGFARLMYSFNCIVYLVLNNAFEAFRYGFNGLLCFDKVFVFFLSGETGDWRIEPKRLELLANIFAIFVAAIFPGLLNVYFSHFGNMYHWMVLQGPIHSPFLWLVLFLVHSRTIIIDAFNSK